MKKLMMMALMCLTVMGLASCGGGSKESENEVEKSKEIKVKPESTAVKGGLAQYLEVVDKEYTLKGVSAKYSGDNVQWSFTVNIEVKRTDASLPNEIDDYVSYSDQFSSTASNVATIGIEVLDKSGNVIFNGPADEVLEDSEEVIKALRMNAGETATIQFKFSTFEKNFEPAAFRLTSDITPNKYKEENLAKKSEKEMASKEEAVNDSTSSSATGDIVDEVVNMANDKIDEHIQNAKDVIDAAGTAIDIYKTASKYL